MIWTDKFSRFRYAMIDNNFFISIRINSSYNLFYIRKTMPKEIFNL